jgi:hypothetical protein
MALQSLIDPQDNFELIRSQIGFLLVSERDNQMSLARKLNKDARLWDFRVFEERSQAWETALNEDQDGNFDLRPIINVWFDSDSSSESSSTRAETQKFTGAYNIDIYGFAQAKETPAGHDAADMLAAFNCQRVTGLARSILMAAENAYLQLPRGTAWDRKVQSRQSYQPRLDEAPVVEVVALRMRFQVSFNEYGPQYEGVPLSQLVAAINRAETGELYIELNFDYSTTL